MTIREVLEAKYRDVEERIALTLITTHRGIPPATRDTDLLRLYDERVAILAQWAALRRAAKGKQR